MIVIDFVERFIGRDADLVTPCRQFSDTNAELGGDEFRIFGIAALGDHFLLGSSDLVAALHGVARQAEIVANMIYERAANAHHGIAAEGRFATILKALRGFDKRQHRHLDHVFNIEEIAGAAMDLPGEFARQRHVRAHALGNDELIACLGAVGTKT